MIGDDDVWVSAEVDGRGVDVDGFLCTGDELEPPATGVLAPPPSATLAVTTIKAMRATKANPTNSRRRQYTEDDWPPTG